MNMKINNNTIVDYDDDLHYNYTDEYLKRCYYIINKINPINKIITKTSYPSAYLNHEKNRYMSVIPEEYNRVKLESGNYINASNISYRYQQYIAAQAPLPNTFNDFWGMIWEKKITNIVMLTRSIEGIKLKAHIYWPVHNSMKFGGILVEPLNHKIIGEKTMRYFRLHYNSKIHDVIHCQYTGWFDNSVPNNTHYISNIINNINTNTTSPVLVHCSAGIGRTGTFIAMMIVNNILKKDIKINDRYVLKIVKHIRKQRMGMVQTHEQLGLILKYFHEKKRMQRSTTYIKDGKHSSLI